MGAWSERAPASLLLVTVLLLGGAPLGGGPTPDHAGFGALVSGPDPGLRGAAPDRPRLVADPGAPRIAGSPWPSPLGSAAGGAWLAGALAWLLAGPGRRCVPRSRTPTGAGPRSPPSSRLA